MGLPVIIGEMDILLREMQINEILSTNRESEKYGLILTFDEARELLESRENSLRSLGRVEIGSEIIKKIIYAFYDSPYIEKDNYVSMLYEIQDIFYYMKNETEDNYGDDELIETIKDLFNNHCGGSIEYLKDELKNIAENVRGLKLTAGFAKGGVNEYEADNS